MPQMLRERTGQTAGSAAAGHTPPTYPTAAMRVRFRSGNLDTPGVEMSPDAWRAILPDYTCVRFQAGHPADCAHEARTVRADSAGAKPQRVLAVCDCGRLEIWRRAR